MPVASYCHHHGPRPGTGPCPDCEHEREQRRGPGWTRYDAAWRKLVAEAIRLHPYCADCGTTHDLTGDHRVPKSKGGIARTVEDIDVVCRSCNSSRGTRGAAGGTGSVAEPARRPLATHISAPPQVTTLEFG